MGLAAIVLIAGCSSVPKSGRDSQSGTNSDSSREREVNRLRTLEYDFSYELWEPYTRVREFDFQFDDVRAFHERRFRDWRERGVFHLGDENIAPDRVELLKQVLQQHAGAALKGRHVRLQEFDVRLYPGNYFLDLGELGAEVRQANMLGVLSGTLGPGKPFTLPRDSALVYIRMLLKAQSPDEEDHLVQVVTLAEYSGSPDSEAAKASIWDATSSAMEVTAMLIKDGGVESPLVVLRVGQ